LWSPRPTGPWRRLAPDGLRGQNAGSHRRALRHAGQPTSGGQHEEAVIGIVARRRYGAPKIRRAWCAPGHLCDDGCRSRRRSQSGNRWRHHIRLVGALATLLIGFPKTARQICQEIGGYPSLVGFRGLVYCRLTVTVARRAGVTPMPTTSPSVRR
jgi:hypothetical protein